MKCPHCAKKIGYFSNALNRFGKIKTCPYCAGKIRVHIDAKLAALWFVPAVLLAIALRPVLGSWSTGPGIVLVLLLSAKLKPAEPA